MSEKDSVFKRKEGKIIVTLFFIVVVFLIILNIWDSHHPSETGTGDFRTSWELVLVNKQNRLPADYKVRLKEFGNSQSVDKRIYPSLKKMFRAAERKGMNSVVASSYRTGNSQKQIYRERIKTYIEQGYSKKEAVSMTDMLVAKPDYSEHQTGLAVDINPLENDGGKLYEWLNSNSYKYGFIVRYPEGKSDITGIDHEPWHFRYVGKTAAKYIYRHNLTLEEYVAAQEIS